MLTLLPSLFLPSMDISVLPVRATGLIHLYLYTILTLEVEGLGNKFNIKDDVDQECDGEQNERDTDFLLCVMSHNFLRGWCLSFDPLVHSAFAWRAEMRWQMSYFMKMNLIWFLFLFRSSLWREERSSKMIVLKFIEICFEMSVVYVDDDDQFPVLLLS